MSDDLTNLLLREYESKDLDYKAPMAWDEGDKATCCALVKDILAMANTIGGYIFVGVAEGANGFVREGLSEVQAASWETTRVNRFVQNYADPPVNTSLRKMTHDCKTFVVIGVPRFTDTPHICQKEYPGILTAPTIYVRTDNNESGPLKTSADLRTIVEQAVRNRSDALLTSFRAILTGSGIKGGSSDEERFQDQFHDAIARFEEVDPFKGRGYVGHREVAFHPARFDTRRFALEQLREAAERASVDYAGWPFLFISRSRPDLVYAVQDGLEAVIQDRDFQENDRVDFWRFQQSGFFYQRVLMWEESYQRKRGMPPAMDVAAMARYSVEAIMCLVQLYDGLVPDNEEITLQLRVTGTEGRVLVFNRPLSSEYRARVPEIRYGHVRSLVEWKAGVVEHALEACREVYVRFNWQHPNLSAAREIIEKLLARRL